MSEDQLSRLLRGVNRSLDNLDRRIADLEGQNRFTTASDWMRANWWGWVSPTQPVSKIVQIHSGVLWVWDSAAATGTFRKLDDTIYDLGTVNGFAAQYHYRWCVLQADPGAGATASPRLHQDANEFGSAGECEADFWANAPSDDLFGNGYIPLSAIIIRNDGNLGVAGAIENVTLADTALSYLFLRDFRPWIHLHKT